ncbi:hypothetical protein ACFXJ8_26325 [Nonomuraea sp. NPDC059194]|uniref:hypothetical protein n=1 Tax=Nonomuraea sp. NPDC059194 TaxID=3346764 RepID=UPI0036B75123
MTSLLADSLLAIDAFPLPAEVAVIAVPAGGVARVHYSHGVSLDYPLPLDDEPWIAVIPGNKELLGWGCVPCWYGSPRGVRNGKHEMDRPVWDEAARAVLRGQVVYVAHERQPYHGGERWTAVSCRTEAVR